MRAACLLLALFLGLGSLEALPVEDAGEYLVQTGETAAAGEGFLIDQTQAPSYGSGGGYSSSAVPQMIATPPPPTPQQMALISSYMKKIKEHQEANGQKWHPFQEEDLAEKLAFVDQVLIPNEDEKNMEEELRKPVGGLPGVEVDLKKYDEAKSGREASAAAAAARATSETKEKVQRKIDLSKENETVNAMIAKFKKESVDKKLEDEYKAAVAGVKKAQAAEKKLRDGDGFRKFAQEYDINTPADKADDYPKRESLGEDSGDHVIVKNMKDMQTSFDDNQEKDHQSADLSSATVQLDDSLSQQALKKLKKLKATVNDAYHL